MESPVFVVRATNSAPCWPPYHRTVVYASAVAARAQAVAAAYRRSGRVAEVTPTPPDALPFLAAGLDKPSLERIEQSLGL